jgi:hypothetical protein
MVAGRDVVGVQRGRWSCSAAWWVGSEESESSVWLAALPVIRLSLGRVGL